MTGARSPAQAMRTCIFCLEEKSGSDFNVEHILPQAFGRFEHNLTLDCVCASCNQLLGDSIDRKLARDSAEGLDRFLTGMKPPGDFKHYGHESTTRVEVAAHGPMRGAWLKYRPSLARRGDVEVEALPQVGFCATAHGVFTYFPLDRLPLQEELKIIGLEKGGTVFLRTWGTTMEDALATMHARGYSVKIDARLPDARPEHGRVEVEAIFRISHPELRAATKMGFGYLAYVLGADTARLPAFDAIRRYVLHDVRPPVSIVELSSASRQPGAGHMLSLAQGGDGSISARLRLFCRFLYTVRLGGLPGRTTDDTTHFFDLESRRAYRVT